ncbi:TraR/DksA family transcriptional regulator [Flexivirga sp.]|uniref:TraR/DksA family transcriptional regulator n=1 Tax=Flexivirga sp. TaxID=1962927 RepID=UPI003F7FC7E9
MTTALRKATGVVAKATGRDGSADSAPKKAAAIPAKATAKKPAAKKSAAKKSAAQAAPAKKAAPAKAAKKSPAKKAAPAKQATAKKATATKASAAAKTAATKTTPTKTTPKKAAPQRAAGQARHTTKTPPVKKSPATQKTTAAAAKAAPTKKAATKTTADKTTTSSAPRKLKVRDDESPWTPKELAAVRAELAGDVERLTTELNGFETDIAGLIKDSGDGAGDDQADAGAKTFEREHEYSLAQNSRDLLEQSVHALERIDDGTYGVCENCGNAIGKLRLQAFPRATLCLTCKAQQERR